MALAMYTAFEAPDRSECVRRYSPLVKRMAHHLLSRLPPSVQLDDMIQAGMIGLMEAASRYRDDQGAQFETFAARRIHGAMLDELRQNDWLPRGMRKAQRKIESALTSLEQRLGRPPAEPEVAAEMKLSLKDYQALLQEAHGSQLFYYDDFAGGDDEHFLDRNKVEGQPDPQQLLHDARFRKSLIKAIEDLPEREKLLMGLYYEQELNFREIGEVLGVTESRVCQLHAQAVTRLRGKLKDW
ncbi:MAG TPA: RNA polymerase sigma factor FliA [Burkholderiales bacterium]|nr:RNA polymerase sigma factor FliA [Burkholderiales bacterium]